MSSRLDPHSSRVGGDQERSPAVYDAGHLSKAGCPGRQQSHRVTLCAALFLVVLLALMMLLSCAADPYPADLPVVGGSPQPAASVQLPGRGPIFVLPGLGVRF